MREWKEKSGELAQRLWPRLKRARLILPWLVSLGAVGLIVYWAIWAIDSPAWTGFGHYVNPEGNLVRAKTLWDWMGLLLVPAVLALAGFWFSRVQKATELEIAEKAREEDRELAKQENDTDREIARDRQRQNTLDSYLDKMTELLLEMGLGTSEPNETADAPENGSSRDLAVSIARARTLSVLRSLDPARAGAVLRFLRETKIGAKSLAEVVQLSQGYLVRVQWHGPEANLSLAYLSGLNLARANMSGATLIDADMSEANLYEANMSHASIMGANLRYAVLHGANLSGADLRWSNLSEAGLSGADLGGADLEGATVSTAELLRARTLDGATMPDGTKYEEWIRRHEAEQGGGEEGVA